MSNLQNQGEGSRGALGDAADRLDRLERGVNYKQLSETRSRARVVLSDAYIASPEEAWAKKFMTQAIGPAPTNFTVPVVPAFVPVGQAPLATQGFIAATVEPAAKRSGS